MGFRPFGEPFGQGGFGKSVGQGGASAAIQTYLQRLQALYGSALKFFVPLNELAGTVADDISATNADGAYAGGFTLGGAGIGDSNAAAAFDGTNGVVSLAANIALIEAVMNKGEATFAIWGKVSAAAVWMDGVGRTLFRLGAAGTNGFIISKATAANRLDVIYNAGGTTKQVNITSFSPTTWFRVVMTVSKIADEMKVYINGVQQGTTQTGLGVWVGALTSTLSAIADFTSPGAGLPWKGSLAYATLLNRPLTPAEVVIDATTFFP